MKTPTPEETAALVKAELRKALKGLLGAPLNRDAVRERIAVQLREIQEVGLLDEAGYDRLAEVLTVDWCGMPEGFDAKALLADVPTALLERATVGYEGLVEGAAGWLQLELWWRKGKLEGAWTFKRLAHDRAAMTFKLQKPVNYLVFELELES